MRRYRIKVNDTEHVVDVEEVTAQTFEVHYGGRTIGVQLVEQQDLTQTAITPGIQPGGADTPVPARPAAGGDTPPATRPPITTPRPALTGGAELAASMTAPMPGVILSVSTEVGTRVAKGDVLMVLEAMKMKNALHASRDGVVAELYVSQGSPVKYGQPLLRFQKD